MPAGWSPGRRCPTPWERPRAEWCERDPADAVATVDRLLADLVGRRGRRAGALGRLLLDRRDRVRSSTPTGGAVSRLLAWHDPRGGRQAAHLDPSLAAVLPSRTGLAVSSVATFFKLLWWRDEAGLDLTGLQWLGLPELVCLGPRRRAVRRAVDARTGPRCGTSTTRTPYGPALDELGVGPDLVPPRVAAGAALGQVRDDHPVEQARGAVLTVAGPRPPRRRCRARGRWRRQPVRLDGHRRGPRRARSPRRPRRWSSPGSSRAACRSTRTSSTPPPACSAPCAPGWSSVAPSTRSAPRTTEQRMAFDAAVPTDGPLAEVDVEGLDMADDHVSVAWPEGADPHAVWAGVLARTREEVVSDVAALRAVGVPVDDVVVTGGWARLPSVLASRVGHRRAHHARHPRGAGGAGGCAARAVGGDAASGGVGPDHPRGAAGGLVHRPRGLEWLPMTDTVDPPRGRGRPDLPGADPDRHEQLRRRQRPR